MYNNNNTTSSSQSDFFDQHLSDVLRDICENDSEFLGELTFSKNFKVAVGVQRGESCEVV